MFEAAHAAPADTVGGTWPEIGYVFAGEDGVVPKGREIVISDAFLCVGTDMTEPPMQNRARRDSRSWRLTYLTFEFGELTVADGITRFHTRMTGMSVLSDLARRLQGGDDTEASPAPDALQLIHNDHEEVNALFATALSESAPSSAKKAAIAKVCIALTVHANMEEALFYPALRKAGKKDEKDSVLEAAEEHASVKELVAKIQRITGRDETLEAKVTVLKEQVEHHVKEEESTIFNEARKVLGKKLDALGEEMQRYKERAYANIGKAPRKKTPAPAKAKKSASTSRKKATGRSKKR